MTSFTNVKRFIESLPSQMLKGITLFDVYQLSNTQILCVELFTVFQRLVSLKKN